MGSRVTDLAVIRHAVAVRRGGTVVPAHWTPSHSWLTLRVIHPGQPLDALLWCGGCDRVEFDARVLDCDLAVAAADDGFLIRDGARLLVRCGVLELEYAVRS